MKTYIVHAEEVTKKVTLIDADNKTDAYLKALKLPRGAFNYTGFQSFHVLASNLEEVKASK